MIPAQQYDNSEEHDVLDADDLLSFEDGRGQALFVDEDIDWEPKG
ncbi:hypothetical protein ACFXKR_39615 [Streptomyces violascens]